MMVGVLVLSGAVLGAAAPPAEAKLSEGAKIIASFAAGYVLRDVLDRDDGRRHRPPRHDRVKHKYHSPPGHHRPVHRGPPGHAVRVYVASPLRWRPPCRPSGTFRHGYRHGYGDGYRDGYRDGWHDRDRASYTGWRY